VIAGLVVSGACLYLTQCTEQMKNAQLRMVTFVGKAVCYLVENFQAVMIGAMISVVIPTLNSEAHLARCLAALVPAAVDGLIRDAVIVDGGSADATAKIADAAGATFITADKGRGQQLAMGAREARSRWLLFLHADTILQPGWEEEAARHMRAVDLGECPPAAAAFRFALDEHGFWPSYLQTMVGLRCWLFGLPYGDQGLLIPRNLYEKVGGFRPLVLMEDVDMARRLGRRRIKFLRAKAVTSARRYQQEGYLRRMLRNLTCLTLYYLRVPSRYIARIYG
jgi:rSAM/selenodomain-associated transferase 2